MSEVFKVKLNGKTIKNIPTLHRDDTIDTLKRKIITVFDKELVYDALYIYVIQKKRFIPELLYKELSQNGKMTITYQRLSNFLLNIEEHDAILEKIKDKNDFNVGELYYLGFDKEHLVNVQVGQVFRGHKSIPYPYVVNPMELKTKLNEDVFLQEHASGMVTTQNSSLVMDIGDIQENIFHVFTADAIFKHMKSHKLESNTQIYFPFLEKVGIQTQEEFEKKREKLLEKNANLLSKKVEKVFDSVDLFYELAESSPYPSLSYGIVEYTIMMHQVIDIILPLEQLFKIIHSTKDMPFVKLNPGFRRENLLRLYSEERTIDGTKIPYMSKAMIIKLIKMIGKSNTLSFFLDESLICSIYENGTVQVMGESAEPLSVDDLTEKIRIRINPILVEIQKYVKESGFDYALFKSLGEPTIEVIGMTYVTTSSLSHKFNMKPYMSCVSSIFNVIQDSITKKDGIQMRYKRVSHYNEMTAIDAFIRDVINKGDQRQTVIEKMKDNFGLSQEESEEKFITFINEVDVEQTIFQNRKLRIKDNPGFATTIEMVKFTSNITITVKDINNINYIDLVSNYVSSLLSMVQGKEEDKVSSICSKKYQPKEVTIPEIIGEGEKPFGENKTPVITDAKELIFDDEGGDDDILDMLLGSDDDDDDEGEDKGEDDDITGSMSGGLPNPEEDLREKDITGLSLSNPNYFSKRMEDRDPSLFLKKKTGKFNAYSRMCPSNIRRQPVILTKEEKERIDKTHPGSYTNSIKYGSDPDKPYYYICPRYWCIPENTSLSEEDVKAGICGGKDAIIPFDAKKVPPGKTIYEFGVDKSNTSAHAYKEFYDEDGKYIEHHPGFISGSKHPDGKCMPCCFKSWTAAEQVRRRQECSQDEQGKKVKVPKKRVQGEGQRDYIKGEEKFPLEPERWGYLPIELQSFFGEDSKKYQVSALEPVLKDDAITLLRQGVETSKTQSFVACIADIYSDYSNEEVKGRIDREIKKLRRKLRSLKKAKTDAEKETEAETEKEKKIDKEIDKEIAKVTKEIHKLKAKPTIKEMKNHIINMLSIDTFTKYQNGNLVQEFYDENKEVSVDDYQYSELYKKLDTTNEDQVDFMEKIISAFENFIAFLKSDDSVIDYQYLWDIVSMPNDALFPNGINLVVFEIPDDDVTNNIEIICPTNYYSRVKFSNKKLTLMLVKKGNYFEPIYLYNNLEKKVNRFLFREQNLKGNPNIKIVLSKVREYMNARCRPLNSLPNVYFFETNTTLSGVLDALEKHMKRLVSIVIHYNGKAVGVNVELSEGGSGFIPCYPSNYKVDSTTPIIFMDDTDHLQDYNATVSFLETVHQKTKLSTLPVCKVVEDGMVVGILTKTNQVVPLKGPEESNDDDLPVCDVSYSREADKDSIVGKKKDNQRIQFTKALEQEKHYYMAFRNLARIELNMYSHQGIKKKILTLIADEDRDSLDSYTSTIEALVTQFKKLLGDIVRFGGKPDKDDLVFPKTNMLSGKDNETLYYLRLADEALRYQRIKMFLFEKNKYLSFSDTRYQLNKNEILILESMISQDYFEDLKAYRRNAYVHSNTYDTTIPLITQKYSNQIIIQPCLIKTKKASTGIVNQLFGSDYFIREYGDYKHSNRSPMCGFDLVKTILKGENKSMENRDIQELLVTAYGEVPEKSRKNLLAIMNSQGKKQWVQNIRGNKLSLETFIMSDDYYLTLIDIWMLASLLELPVAFIGKAVTAINDKMVFTTQHNKNAYYFVRVFVPHKNTVPRYHLVESPESKQKIQFSANKLQQLYFEVKRRTNLTEKRTKNELTIDEYIKYFNV